MAKTADEAHLRRALRLAARGRYRTAPNPRVGAVLVRDGTVVGEGWHRRAGEPHAEAEALAAAGDRARGATLYLNLEPCRHHGRTPPCVDALLGAGVARVVASHADPDPRVSGRGFARLREAGVEVEVGALARDAAALNLPFLTARALGRPAVTLKWAMSLDGKIATAAGESRWISSEGGRRWALALREEHDAILVGSGTALADDPLLTRRLGLAAGPILRVVVDRRLRLPPEAKMLGEEGEVLVFTEAEEGPRRAALEARGVRVERLECVDPDAVLAALHARGVQCVLVEGGAEAHAAFFESGLWDRVEAACAPLLVGGRRAPGPIGGTGARALAAAPRLERLSVRRRGDDLVLSGLRKGALEDLLARIGLQP
ncbi:MAG TPA: bifunctional diaminohydroxyphosphoribosylaminopyrimidine deaminase/5-amino-6-(5-phosphoribosylamino)uracil reductase RibD [Thermoanaerobaculia bacterium]|nr:bifunctional diaminohydroxyphosphoribosylaminopyrimidine deaminase/5-amino-6-(5-phosphoribosylamino)uracil reductase RibD [Thermoanaerobaculia bacterium]